jgi:hypothetical protein
MIRELGRSVSAYFVERGVASQRKTALLSHVFGMCAVNPKPSEMRHFRAKNMVKPHIPPRCCDVFVHKAK